MVLGQRLDSLLKKIEQKTIYPIAKYVYLIRSEENNTHNRLNKLLEFIPTYLSYILLSEFKEKYQLVSKERQLFITECIDLLKEPTYGQRLEMLRKLLQLYEDVSKSNLESQEELVFSKLIYEDIYEKRQIPSLQENKVKLFDIIKERKPNYSLKIGSKSSKLIETMEMLNTYRNRFFGHGDIASNEYELHNEILIELLVDLINNIRVIHAYSLAFVEQVKVKNKTIKHDLFLSMGRSIDFERCTHIDNEIIDPNQVYLCEIIENDEEIMNVIPKLSLHPLVIFYDDSKEGKRNLFFISSIYENHVSYTSYPNNTLFEPKKPREIYQSFFEKYNVISRRQTISEGESIRESETVLPINKFNNNESTYEMVDPAENPQIWEKFEGDYYSYNAPFQLEKQTNLDLLINKHVSRYTFTQFKKAKYLFFSGDLENNEDLHKFTLRLENFVKFMTKLYEKIPTILETKVEVYVVRQKMPNITFFAGEKVGNPYAIMYFHNENFMNNDMPRLAFLSKDEKLVASLKSNFKKDIESNIVVKYPISAFIKSPDIKERIINELSSSIRVRDKFANYFSNNDFINSTLEKKQMDGIVINDVTKILSPFEDHLQFFMEQDSNRFVQTNKAFEDWAFQYYKVYLNEASSSYHVMLGDGSKQLISKLLLAIEGDLLIATPSTSEYYALVKITQDQVIYLDNKKIEPENFEKIIQDAREKGNKPSKLLIDRSIHSFWINWELSKLKRFISILKKYGIVIIIDGLYKDMDENQNYFNLEKYYPTGTITVTEVSKHLSIQGYRLGICFFPSELKKIYEVVSLLDPGRGIGSIPNIATKLFINYFDTESNIFKRVEECTLCYKYIFTYMCDKFLIPYNVEYEFSCQTYDLYLDFEKYSVLFQNKGINTNTELVNTILLKSNLLTEEMQSYSQENNSYQIAIKLHDFDGTKALQILANKKNLTSEQFVEEYAPNLKLAIENLVYFFDDLQW